MNEAPSSQRLDKWLFFARILKSREKAAALVKNGYVRINGVRCEQAAKQIKPGDVLTIAMERQVHVLKVLAAGTRRGPAPQARLLYEPDLPGDPASRYR